MGHGQVHINDRDCFYFDARDKRSIPSLLNGNRLNMIYVHTGVDIRHSSDGSNMCDTLFGSTNVCSS